MSHIHQRTEAVFLKKEDRGEADQVFTLFTKEFGKIKVLAKGIRKITSKLRSCSDLFYYSDIEFIQGKGYKTLTDSVLIKKFKDYDNIDYYHELAWALDGLTEEKDERIWNLLLNPIENDLSFYYSFWNLFSYLGYKPELYNCVLCQRKLLPETLFFVPKEGGICCWKCLEDKEIIEITVGAIQALRLFLTEERDVLSKLKVCEEDKVNIKEVSFFYLAYLKNSINPQARLDRK